MRSSSLLLLIVAAFIAASVVGALFVLGSAASAGPYEGVPGDALAILEASEPAGLQYLTGRLLPVGRALPAWIGALASPPDLLPAGTLAIALLPPDGEAPREVMIVLRPDAPEALEGVVREARARLGRGGGRWVDRRHQDQTIELLAEAPEGPPLCLCRIRGAVVIAGSSSGCARALDADAGRRPPLSASRLFGEIRSRWDRRRTLALYLSATELPPAPMTPLAASAQRLLGVTEIRTISGSVRLRDGRALETFEIVHAESGSGLAASLAAWVPPEWSLERAGRILPGDLPFYAALSLHDPAWIWDRLPDLAAPAGWGDAESVRSRQRGLDQLLNADFGKDLLGVFSGAIVLGLEPAAAGEVWPRSLVAALPVERPAALTGLLRRGEGLARLLGGRMVPAPGGGIVSWEIPPAPLNLPSYRIDRDLFAVASRASLLAMEPASSSLAARADVAAALAQLPRRAHALFVAQGDRLSPGDLPLCGAQAGGWDGRLRAMAITLHRRRVHVETLGPTPSALECLSEKLAAVFAGSATPAPAEESRPATPRAVEEEPL